jgi:hypothetical protein
MNMVQALRKNNKRYNVTIKAIYIYFIKENVIDRITTHEIHLKGLGIMRDLFSMNHTLMLLLSTVIMSRIWWNLYACS